MPLIKLIADSGSTKTEWCLLYGGKKRIFITQGMSPYFVGGEQIQNILLQELKPQLGKVKIDRIYYYGTGCSNRENVKVVKNAIQYIFPGTEVSVDHDLMGAAKALCGDEKGIACILGTGSNSCYYNGNRIVKNSPGLGFILGDEGSGAYLGKKVIQYFLYHTFDRELHEKFQQKFAVTDEKILDAVYKKPLPNRYLASYAIFLAENRGHYMIENIIEDGLNDFFFNHVDKYRESRNLPIHFVGSIALGFKDVLSALCEQYQMKLGRVIKNPIEGLAKYHTVLK